MDLIYRGENFVEKGILRNYLLDYEASTEPKNCDFELKMMVDDNPLSKGDYIYIEGEEYGGRVDSIQFDTANRVITATGRSWRGILASKVLVPPEGEAYKRVSGNVGDIIQGLIRDAGLQGLFSAPISEFTIGTYQFHRYTDLYSGLVKLCEKNGLKLKLYWKRSRVIIEAVKREEYVKANALTSDLFDFKITTSASTNHIIGLGKGELLERQVVHKYLDTEGNVGDTQAFFGVDEIAEVYENVNLESLEELEEMTSDELLKSKKSDKLEITAYNLSCDIGDKVEASDLTTGISITRYVTDKILTIDGEISKIQYKVGNI